MSAVFVCTEFEDSCTCVVGLDEDGEVVIIERDENCPQHGTEKENDNAKNF